MPLPRKYRYLACLWAGLIVALLMPASAHAIRVMTWNVLNYPNAIGDSREDDFRAVLEVIQPDLLVVQEMNSLSGATEFLNDVLDQVNPGEWALAPYFFDPVGGRACYYRTAQLDYVSRIILGTALRDINGFVFRPDGYSSSAAEFRIYTLHLKASQGEEAKRLAEAQVLRTHLNALPSSTPFMVAGDFNIYTSSEPAWAKLTGSEADNDGRVFDPINRVGNWHNNSFFADVHTQSTRTTQLGDGGATGGIDDRFDMILANDDLLTNDGFDYVATSYVNFGQDGQHFNSAINSSPPNAVVSAVVANALFAASDHLPVYLDVQVPSMMQVNGDLAFGSVIVGASADRSLQVTNDAIPPADFLNYSLSADSGFLVPGGSLVVPPGNSFAIPVSLDTSLPGGYIGSVTVSGDAPDNPSDVFSATGVVLDHAQPSTSAAGPVTSDTVSFGSFAQGGFTDQSIEVHNHLYDGGFQALLEAYEVSFGGSDAARFSLTNFSPASVGSSPASFSVHFDDSNATSNTYYEAILTIATRDQQDLAGATNLADLQWQLDAFVTDVGVDVAQPVVQRTRLHGNFPNPFNPVTTIRFDLVSDGDVELQIFSVQGRLVRTLVHGRRDAGMHRVAWNGLDDLGQPASSGVFFYRLRAGDIEQTRRMTLMR